MAKAVREFLGDEAGGQAPFGETGMGHHRGQEGDVVGDAADEERIQRPAHVPDGGLAGVAPGDQLGDQGVVMDGYLVALMDTRVDAHARAFGGRPIADQAPHRGQKVAHRVLGIDARLDGPAIEAYLGLRERELFTGGDADHPFHQVQP